MGFELILHYYEKDEDGEYNKDKVLEMKKKIGSAYEEVSLSKVASTIFLQKARRDIWVLDDVEIYEYQKVKLSFKETKDGIVIKHKKFSLKDDLSLDEEEVKKVETLPSIPKTNGRKPLKKVTLDPDLAIIIKIKQRNLNFTPNKEYSVFKETPTNTLGITKYLMIDDNNREIEVSSEFFISNKFVYEKDVGRDKFDSKSNNIDLDIPGEIKENIINLR